MESLPSRFNPVELARARQHCKVTLPVTHFTRFSELLASQGGDVVATVEFSLQGRRALANGTLQASVEVTCQRCVKPAPLEIATEFTFGFVSSEEDAESLDEKLDPVLIDSNGELTVVDLLEDELILQVPQRVVHSDEEQCDPTVIDAVNAEPGVPANTHNPFSGLDELLKN